MFLFLSIKHERIVGRLPTIFSVIAYSRTKFFVTKNSSTKESVGQNECDLGKTHGIQWPGFFFSFIHLQYLFFFVLSALEKTNCIIRRLPAHTYSFLLVSFKMNSSNIRPRRNEFFRYKSVSEECQNGFSFFKRYHNDFYGIPYMRMDRVRFVKKKKGKNKYRSQSENPIVVT